MEEMATYISSLGLAGFIAYTLFNKQIKDSENDKQYYRDLIKKIQDEAKADREVYINSINLATNSINSLVNKIENVEQDISEIKQIIKK